MRQRTRHLIAYDISDDRRRNRLAKLLLDYGDRVQHSVFEADLSSQDVERILRRAAKLVTDPDDSLRIYPLCAACFGAVRSLGREVPLDDSDLIII